MKNILFILFLLIANISLAQPANNNCASATVLTIGAALDCGETTLASTLQGGECFTNYAGATEHTTWYRFTSNNDSLVLNVVKTNLTNCVSPHIRIWGPFAPGAGCLPGCGSEIYNSLVTGDPGAHILLTGLATSGNRDYLVQIQDVDCGGPNDGHMEYCISVVGPSSNFSSATADLIDACGTAFNETTNGGYWNNGTSTGFNNLDGNGATTCGGCAAGDDVPFVINNISWTTFCSLTAGTWQITVNGIGGCTLAPPNQGIQASIFTGTTGALVNQGNSPSPISPGGSWTSPVITVNAGQCAYLMIDGFAGDACNYSVTLTNITGGCIILPIELLSFSGKYINSYNQLDWSVATQTNNDYFLIERSTDGINWIELNKIEGNGTTSNITEYSSIDYTFNKVINYYRLKQVDFDGNYEYFNIVAIDNTNSILPKPIKVVNLLGQDVSDDYTGIKILFYSDGSYVKKSN